MENIEKVLENGIISLFDKFGNKIDFDRKELKYYKSKYSSVPKDTLTLFIDDKPLVNLRDNKYHVSFKCNCGNISKIHLSKYLKKDKMSCCKCRENEEKIEWHKKYFEMKRNGMERGNKKRGKTVIYDFDNESEEFKKKYFERNLTEEEFSEIKHLIYSVDGVVVKDKNFDFLIAEPCFNAKKYSQAIKIDGKVIKLKNINIICCKCGEIFHITRQLKEHYRNGNFYCKPCVFTNFTFSRKKHESGLMYQSNEELKFINRCIENGIKIENGLKIPYFFNGKMHVYNSDYFLPDLKIIIEIKDNHIWHKKQIESGKWIEKEKSAIEFSNKNGFKFQLLFPNDIDSFFKHMKEIV